MRFPFSNRLRTIPLVAAACVVASLAAVPHAARAGSFPVGFVRMTIPGETALRGDPSGKLRVVVWYPAPGATTVPLAVGPPNDPLFEEGMAAEGARFPADASHLPLIVISHGTGGTNMDLSWLCIALAGRGFVVASVDHPGNNALDPQTVPGLALWWLRTNDLARTIDAVLADPRFASHINASAIGAAGFSLGGATVLAIAGARVSPPRLIAYCAAHPQTEVCDGEATPGVPDLATRAADLARTDPAFAAAVAAAGESRRDPRIKAVFSIAPALGPELVPESLASIAIPVEILAGAGDPVVAPSDNAVPDALAIPDASLTLLPHDVKHYTFLTDCTATGRIRLAPICEDAGPFRVAVHRTAIDLATAFFVRTLGSP